MQLEHARTLAVIVESRTFEAAAARLHLTPSAVSQRVKALEREVGAVVVTRTVPCEPTSAGEVLVRLGRQVMLLEEEAQALIGHRHEPVDLSVAVNQDSLATWFLPVLSAAAGWDDVALRVRPDDQDRTAAWLRNGTVLAAVTADAAPVPGCRATRLGELPYLACAHADLEQRWCSLGRFDFSRAPMVRFDAQDRLQHQFLARRGIREVPQERWVPSTEGLNAAVALGLGWGLVPQPMLADLRRSYPRLVVLDERPHTVELHWQRWKVESPVVDRLSAVVRAAARAGLQRVED